MADLTAAEALVKQEAKAVLLEFYQTHNPERINIVDKLLSQHKGSMEVLLNKVVKCSSNPCEVVVPVVPCRLGKSTTCISHALLPTLQPEMTYSA